MLLLNFLQVFLKWLFRCVEVERKCRSAQYYERCVCSPLNSTFKQFVCVEPESLCPVTGRDAPAPQTFSTQENGETHGSSAADAASRC